MMFNDFNFYSHLQNARRQIIQAIQNKSNLDAPLMTSSGLPALCEALDKYQLRYLVEPLLQAGADPNICVSNTRIPTPLHYAAATDTALRQLILLISYGAEVNNHGEYKETPLMIAIQFGAYKAATALLEHGANPNIQDIFGHTALVKVFEYYPAYERNPHLRRAMSELLLRYGANPFIKNVYGKTALDIARKNGFKELAQLIKNKRTSD